MNSNPLYEERDWRGKSLLICPLCKADTFDRLTMLRHLVDAHDSELALVQLVDMEGSLPASASPIASDQEQQSERGDGDVFEVELIEINPTIDAHDHEHTKYTIKE